MDNWIKLELDSFNYKIVILCIKMDKTRSAFGYKKELGGGERIILLFLFYG